LDILFPAVLVLIICALAFVIQRRGMAASQWRSALLVGLPLVICYTFSKRPIRFALGIGGILLCQNLTTSVHGRSVERVRSFFGIHRITQDAGYRLLIHGNTEHGRQNLNPTRSREPLAYYTRSGPVGDLLGALSAGGPRLRKTAVLGLGAGAIAAYAEADQQWTFYEIDPAVISLARQHFTYLSEAIARGARVSVVQGDARLQISRSPDKYDLIILDAFSSDSIPTHLFTREAFEAYRGRLAETGMLAVHYSSRYFNLRPVIGSVSQSIRPPLTALFREDLWVTEADKLAGKAPSKWAVLLQGQRDRVLPVLLNVGWQPIQLDSNRKPWTDDHSNVLGALELSRE